MRWNELTPDVTSIDKGGVSNATITSIEYDSRKVLPGSIFVAMRGGTTDGNRYIATALKQGATGIITDSAQAYATLPATTPRILVEHGRKALAQASAAFFRHPERKLHSTGVTGTNGKTTTAFLIESLLNAAARKTVLVGTIEYHVAGEVRPSAHTTPESRDLFELMAEGANLGATELVMEVSSHALDQGRVEGVNFDTAVFTNLTRDHLDYHGTMEAYFAAKKLLFDGTRYPAPRVSILYAADPLTPQLAEAAKAVGSEVVTYATTSPAAENICSEVGRGFIPGTKASESTRPSGPEVRFPPISSKSRPFPAERSHADWRATEIRLTPAGANFTLVTPHGTEQVQSNLAGEVNVLNLLAALAAAHARGIHLEDLIAAIPTLNPVPGRFQPVNAGQPFTVIVDYAHTDDALHNLTALARQLAPKPARILTLFGCGGDRDRTKRPRMGQAAGEGSDFVIVTSDNPRSEDPLAIIQEILPGVQATCTRYAVQPDRATAIELALAEASPGDVVLIAGKGHEKQQILRDGPIFFDDAQVALSALGRLGYGEGK